MKLKKIHQVLMVEQSQLLKQYIDFNTEKREKEVIALRKTSLS